MVNQVDTVYKNNNGYSIVVKLLLNLNKLLIRLLLVLILVKVVLVLPLLVVLLKLLKLLLLLMLVLKVNNTANATGKQVTGTEDDQTEASASSDTPQPGITADDANQNVEVKGSNNVRVSGSNVRVSGDKNALKAVQGYFI